MVEQIIDKMPNSLTLPIEKARYIYIELAKILEFNITYNNTNSVNQYLISKQYNNIYNLKNNLVMCHNWADIYISLLKKVGIKAYKFSRYHAWVIIELDDMFIYADATYNSYNDFSRIKHQDETINFFPVSSDITFEIPSKYNIDGFDEILQEIDKKIGYINNQVDILNQLKANIINFDKLKDKCDYLFRNINVLNGGYYEGNSYIKHIIKNCLFLKERDNILMTELKKTQDDKTVDIIRCISLLENNQYYYYLFNPSLGLIETNKCDIMNYSNDNYGITYCNDSLNDYPIIFNISKNIMFDKMFFYVVDIPKRLIKN